MADVAQPDFSLWLEKLDAFGDEAVDLEATLEDVVAGRP